MNPKLYFDVIKQSTKLINFIKGTNINAPQLLYRMKMPCQYTYEDYKSDKLAIQSLNNHPYIIEKICMSRKIN